MPVSRGLLAMIAVAAVAAVLLNVAVSLNPVHAAGAVNDARLAKAYRFERSGWIFVHLEGTPREIGFQHGYLLAPEIDDAFKAIRLSETHSTERDWAFFRQTAQNVLWPHIEDEYRQELTGIAEGLKARSVPLDLWDVVALNAMEEVPGYYVPWLKSKEEKTAAQSKAPGNCSAFVATGSWTKDHQVVIAHNNWTEYLDGARWRIMFDIVPARGYRILMDGFPGIIASDDDFGLNSDGLIVTETTISDFFGFDPNGKPEFVRARKALQYAGSIEEYVRIMNDGNNGGYANDWLLADRKTGEIAQFEQGLKHTRLWRTKDGYFVGSNFARDPEVIKDETTFDPKDLSSSPNARRVRWEQLMRENKGKIDLAMAQKFMGDHYDSFDKTEEAGERSLCGHIERSPRGFKGWLPAYYPGGTAQNKATDSRLAAQMSLVAHMGHACGGDFKAKPFLIKHAEFAWQEPVLIDLDAGGWATFKAGERETR